MMPPPLHGNLPPPHGDMDPRLRGQILNHNSSQQMSAASNVGSRMSLPTSSNGPISPMIDEAIVQVGAARNNGFTGRGSPRGNFISRGRGRGWNMSGGIPHRNGPNVPNNMEIICLLDLPRVPYAPLAGVDTQVQYIQQEFDVTLPKIEISHQELCDRESIRRDLQEIIRGIIESEELPNNKDFDRKSVILRAIGSLKTGNATRGSDMDLALLSPCSSIDPGSPESTIPRKIEDAFLLINYGARLLTNTRVPIIKCCTMPSEDLLEDLREKVKADMVGPNDKKQEKKFGTPVNTDEKSDEELVRLYQLAINENWYDSGERAIIQKFVEECSGHGSTSHSPEYLAVRAALKSLPDVLSRYHEPMKSIDFLKEGRGIHLDINFSNHLAIHNTALLRCYNICDLRIRAMILFVKSWAKARDINSAYKRTLSSYGYVLMVLYYVVNIADPPIAPNLQLERGLTRGGHPDVPRNCDGFDIQFWRDEESIGRARDNGQLLPDGRRNTESIGSLLRGFFLHFSGDAPHDRFDKRHAFVWTHEVISLRVGGGRLTKQQKTWTTARTETVESKIPNVKPKEIRHNYLLCIEDPFELTHNVARTVSHDGIVAIRDEFRRAAMLIRKGGAMGDELVSLLKEYKHSELDRKPCFFGPNPANLTRRPAPRFTSPQTQKGSGSMPNRPISKINNEKATTPTKDEIVDLAPLEATDLGREVSPREPLVTSLEPENTKENAQKGSSPTGQEVDAVVEKWIAVSKFLETARQGALGRGAGQKPNQSKLRGRKKFNEHTQLKGSEVGTSYDDQFPPLGHKKRISFDEKVHNSEESETKEPNQQASPGRSILSASPKSSPAPSPPPSRQMNEVQRLRETAAVPNEFLVSAGVVKSGSSSPEP